MLQLVNPKAWAVALIVSASYVDVAAPRKSLAILVGLFALMNISSISVWAISGSALKRYLARGRRIAVFNPSMAILLLVSMIPVLMVPS
ncbi:lysine transporter LysE [Hoeflea sp. WL0058]|uniref:Lysine transporter LysE n=1 Tax=Flavimaribacter sediminis TaxID=2865987 RepID=A0AAE2ZPD6_9HYPH|nr:lysine transporter LysE [Flavimaribacter sediminis]MBW8640549.1 lysine transporter LysE [Flavimaribacter sediminis]